MCFIACTTLGFFITLEADAFAQRRNEALDIFVYNFVALKILNPNFEVLEKNMAGIEAKPLKKVNKPYKIRREGSFVSGFK